MKMKKTIFTVMVLATFSLSGGMVIAAGPGQGPAPFSSWDKDNNGSIDEQEFNAMREQRQAMAKSGGRMGKNMANAPTFSQLDKDGNGLISQEELSAMQQKRGYGQGQKNKSSMRQGKQGKGQAIAGTGRMNRRQGCQCGQQTASLNPGMGQRYQAMDEVTREKHDAFRTATIDLRKQIAAKRAEKQAIMRSVNPDPDQAAQLTRDLIALRSQLQVQAKEAGIEIAQAGTGNNRHGGRGHNQGIRL